MKYINTRTGAIIDSPCLISGGDWIEYGKQKPKKEVVKEVKKTVEETSTDLTKEEVMNELDALGMEYNKKAKKEDLIKLMMGE